MLVTFLRHAQSEANVLQNVFSRDARLTKLGLEQSRMLGGHFDLVFCSPMRRTRDTLANSKITYEKLIIVPEARECRWAVSDLLEDDKEPDDYLESNEEVTERCHKLYKTLTSVKDAKKKKILVVSHCNFIMEFTSIYAPVSLNLDNAEMKQVEVSRQS